MKDIAKSYRVCDWREHNSLLGVGPTHSDTELQRAMAAAALVPKSYLITSSRRCLFISLVCSIDLWVFFLLVYESSLYSKEISP